MVKGRWKLPGAVASIGCRGSGVHGAGIDVLVAACCGTEHPGSGLGRWGDLANVLRKGPVVEGVGLWAVLLDAQYLSVLEHTSR